MKGRTESGRCKSLVGVASWSGFSRRTERCTQRQVISGAIAFQLRFSLRRNGNLWENMECCSASGTQASWSKKHQKPSLAKIMQTKCTGIQCTAYAIWWALSWVTIWCSGDAAAKCCLISWALGATNTQKHWFLCKWHFSCTDLLSFQNLCCAMLFCRVALSRFSLLFLCGGAGMVVARSVYFCSTTKWGSDLYLPFTLIVLYKWRQRKWYSIIAIMQTVSGIGAAIGW